ncbi:UII gamma [Agathobacter rectalis]|uniref:UII gamma n=1 Tax=Agathobacter rectalis TaxID=39491 RepID=A0A3E5AKN0_9FIRM|nr:UII gamma [Agathobacter rectalis]NSC38738.1 UII gamma [Agathobacter rectalis]NSC54407.1 UII gamma [Agathobacter rectalis]NSC60435.1 UII gamma [Agathobacter rectalis]NSC66077.1 UII gamma [Agathobacter rectalis]
MYPAVCPAFFIGKEQEMAERKLIWSECKSSHKKRGGWI